MNINVQAAFTTVIVTRIFPMVPGKNANYNKRKANVLSFALLPPILIFSLFLYVFTRKYSFSPAVRCQTTLRGPKMIKMILSLAKILIFYKCKKKKFGFS
jgi:hypothetical protein